MELNMTVKEIISKYLYYKIGSGTSFHLKTHQVNLDIYDFAKEKLGIVHTPETYAREWRKIREPYDIGFEETIEFNGLFIRLLTDDEYEEYKYAKTQNIYLIEKGK